MSINNNNWENNLENVVNGRAYLDAELNKTDTKPVDTHISAIFAKISKNIESGKVQDLQKIEKGVDSLHKRYVKKANGFFTRLFRKVAAKLFGDRWGWASTHKRNEKAFTDLKLAITRKKEKATESSKASSESITKKEKNKEPTQTVITSSEESFDELPDPSDDTSRSGPHHRIGGDPIPVKEQNSKGTSSSTTTEKKHTFTQIEQGFLSDTLPDDLFEEGKEVGIHVPTDKLDKSEIENLIKELKNRDSVRLVLSHSTGHAEFPQQEFIEHLDKIRLEGVTSVKVPVQVDSKQLIELMGTHPKVTEWDLSNCDLNKKFMTKLPKLEKFSQIKTIIFKEGTQFDGLSKIDQRVEVISKKPEEKTPSGQLNLVIPHLQAEQLQSMMHACSDFQVYSLGSLLEEKEPLKPLTVKQRQEPLPQMNAEKALVPKVRQIEGKIELTNKEQLENTQEPISVSDLSVLSKLIEGVDSLSSPGIILKLNEPLGDDAVNLITQATKKFESLKTFVINAAEVNPSAVKDHLNLLQFANPNLKVVKSAASDEAILDLMAKNPNVTDWDLSDFDVSDRLLLSLEKIPHLKNVTLKGKSGGVVTMGNGLAIKNINVFQERLIRESYEDAKFSGLVLFEQIKEKDKALEPLQPQNMKQPQPLPEASKLKESPSVPKKQVELLPFKLRDTLPLVLDVQKAVSPQVRKLGEDVIISNRSSLQKTTELIKVSGISLLKELKNGVDAIQSPGILLVTKDPLNKEALGELVAAKEKFETIQGFVIDTPEVDPSAVKDHLDTIQFANSALKVSESEASDEEILNLIAKNPNVSDWDLSALAVSDRLLLSLKAIPHLKTITLNGESGGNATFSNGLVIKNIHQHQGKIIQENDVDANISGLDLSEKDEASPFPFDIEAMGTESLIIMGSGEGAFIRNAPALEKTSKLIKMNGSQVEQFIKDVKSIQSKGIVLATNDSLAENLSSLFSKYPSVNGVVLDVVEVAPSAIINHADKVQFAKSAIKLSKDNVSDQDILNLIASNPTVTEWDLSEYELSSQFLISLQNLPHAINVTLPGSSEGVAELSNGVKISHISVAQEKLLRFKLSDVSISGFAKPNFMQHFTIKPGGIWQAKKETPDEIICQFAMSLPQSGSVGFDLSLRENNSKKFINFLSTFPNVKSISLFNTEFANVASEQEIMELIFGMPPKVTESVEYDFSRNEKISPNFIFQLIRLYGAKKVVLPNNFKLGNNQKLPSIPQDVVITNDASQVSQRSLTLVVPESINEKSVMKIVNSCPGLWKLDLSKVSGLSTDVIPALWNLEKLTQLKLPKALSKGSVDLSRLKKTDNPQKVKLFASEIEEFSRHASRLYEGLLEYSYLYQIPLSRQRKFVDDPDLKKLDAESVFFWTMSEDYKGMQKNYNIERVDISENTLSDAKDFLSKFPKLISGTYKADATSVNDHKIDKVDETYFTHPAHLTIDQAATFLSDGVPLATDIDFNETLLYSSYERKDVPNDNVKTVVFDSLYPADAKKFLEGFKNLETVIYNGKHLTEKQVTDLQLHGVTFKKEKEIRFEDQSDLKDKEVILSRYRASQKSGNVEMQRFYRTMIELFAPEILEENEDIAKEPFTPHQMFDAKFDGLDLQKHILVSKSSKIGEQFVGTFGKTELSFEQDSAMGEKTLVEALKFLTQRNYKFQDIETAFNLIPFAEIYQLKEMKSECWKYLINLVKNYNRPLDKKTVSAITLLGKRSFYDGFGELGKAIDDSPYFPNVPDDLLNNYDEMSFQQFPALSNLKGLMDERGALP